MRAPKLFVVNIAEAVWMRDEDWMGEHVREIHEWTITIEGTNYRCVIRECPCGLRRQLGVIYKPVPHDAPDYNTRAREVESITSCSLINCTCKSEAHRGVKPSERDRVCHGWHRARIDKFFDHLKKHGKAKVEPRAAVGIPRGSLMVPFAGVGYVHRDAANMTRVVAQNKHSAEEWERWHRLVETVEVGA